MRHPESSARRAGAVVLSASLVCLASLAHAQAPAPSGARSPGASANVSAGERGIAVNSGDDAFVLRLRGLLQVDSRWFLQDTALDDRDSILIRRARPIIDATVLRIVDLRLVPDFAEGRAQVFDAYVDVRPRPWLKLRAGKFKPPVGLERLQGDPDLPLNERALTSNLSPARDTGAQLFGDLINGFISYSIGIFNGAPDNANGDTDSNHAKDFAGRVFLQPLNLRGPSRFGLLGFGMAATVGDQLGSPAAPNLPVFRTAGQNQFFGYLVNAMDPTGTAFSSGQRSRGNPQLYYYVGPLGLLADYVASRETVHRGDESEVLNHRAWHATASVVLRGKNAYDGVVPNSRLDRELHTWGALELAARVGQLTVDPNAFPRFADPDRSARKATAAAVALNWYLGRNARFNVNYERTWFVGGAPGGANRLPENALLSRLQVTF